MAFASHIVTVRRLKKYIDDVIGKKANLPDTSKTIIGNIGKINSDLTEKSQRIFTPDLSTEDKEVTNTNLYANSPYLFHYFNKNSGATILPDGEIWGYACMINLTYTNWLKLIFISGATDKIYSTTYNGTNWSGWNLI